MNSMFGAARNLVWLEAMEKMVDTMLTRICKLWESYFKFDDSSIVTSFRNELHSLWEGTETMVVMETEPKTCIYQHHPTIGHRI